jgi:hypothetical protein
VSSNFNCLFVSSFLNVLWLILLWICFVLVFKQHWMDLLALQ